MEQLAATITHYKCIFNFLYNSHVRITLKVSLITGNAACISWLLTAVDHRSVSRAAFSWYIRINW